MKYQLKISWAQHTQYQCNYFGPSSSKIGRQRWLHTHLFFPLFPVCNGFPLSWRDLFLGPLSSITKYVDTSCNLNLICQHAKNFQMYWSIYLARILSSQNSRCHQTDSDRAVVIRLSQVAMSEWSSTQNSNVI